MKKNIAIIGSTGSIGTQTLDVIRANPNLFSVEILTAHNNADLLISQALEFNPNAVAIANEKKYPLVKEALKNTSVKVFAGEDAVAQIVEYGDSHVVLLAVVGYAGLKPAVNAIKAKKNIALANKETLVVAGQLIGQMAIEYGSSIIPVDSEHSAIFQCLAGERSNTIEKLILTASGGPFRGKNAKQLENVSIADALNHPNWSMGSKITIDSATLMNKGLEVIEAYWLFNIKPSQIEVVVHPQSVIHSMVQFCDGSIKAQMGLPDMKIPITYAMAYPNRIKTNFPRFNFQDYPVLTFEKPDTSNFPCLNLAYDALQKKGNAPCVLNAANEAAVEAFLSQRITFTQIPQIIEKALREIDYIQEASLQQLVETHNQTILFVNKLLKK